MKKIQYKAIALVAPLSSIVSMGLALLVAYVLISLRLTVGLADFEATFLKILVLVALTPLFSSAISFFALYLWAKEAKAANAWIALAVSLLVDVTVGFPVLVLSAVAAK